MLQQASFEEYLTAQGLKPDTIEQHRRYIHYFICWMSDESLFLSQITHSEILDFADQLKQEGRSINQINRVLLAVRYYFSYLDKEGATTHNPAAGITLKGRIRNVPHDLLEKEELEELYDKY